MKNWRFGAAHYAAIVCTVVLSLVACGGDTISTPTTSAPEPAVASAPAPAAPVAPAPNPSPTPEAGEPAKAWEVECSATGQMKVIYNGEASHAEVLTYYTSFDGPQQFAPETKILPTGESWTRTFPACSQSDAEPISGNAAGHCYFDKNGVPFNGRDSAAKVAECRTQCVPEWRRDQEYEVIYGPWSGPGSSAQSFTVQAEEQFSCGTRTVTYRYTETNSCTKETRTVDVKQEDQTKECEVSCEDANPNYGAANGSGSKTVTTTTPATPTYYWYNFEDDDDGQKTACQSEGGTWYNSVDIPPPGGGNKEDICRTTVNHGNEWNPPGNNNSGDLEKVEQGSAAKLSLSVSSSWTVAAGKAQTLTFEIVYNGSTVKKSKTQEFACGQGGQGSLTWGPGDPLNSSPNYSAGDGHITGSYTLRVKRGATVVGTFPLP